MGSYKVQESGLCFEARRDEVVMWSLTGHVFYEMSCLRGKVFRQGLGCERLSAKRRSDGLVKDYVTWEP